VDKVLRGLYAAADGMHEVAPLYVGMDTFSCHPLHGLQASSRFPAWRIWRRLSPRRVPSPRYCYLHVALSCCVSLLGIRTTM
jgi:hypothetical protein